MDQNHSRRDFFKQLSVLGIGTMLRPQLIFAQSQPQLSQRKPVVVFIFLRGAQDSLSMLSPVGEENYYKWRPNISIKQDKVNALQIDNHFQLHPAMKSLYPLWNNKEVAFITQFGSPDLTRSHFDAQEYFESGTPGLKSTSDGFLNRAIALLPNKNKLSAMAIQPTLPQILRGKEPTLAFNNLKDFQTPKSELSKSLGMGFEEMYQQATDKVFRGVGAEAFENIELLKLKSKNLTKANYSKSNFANGLKDIAQLIKADLGLSIAVTEMGGWDTHVNQGSNEGTLAKRFTEFSEALAAFREDLAAQMDNVLIIACTEFGRTVRENGNKGTDHGHGSTALIVGGGINGKNLYGQWKELKSENLHEDRDISVTTDYRSLMAGVLHFHLGCNDFKDIFPSYSPDINLWRSLFLKT